MSDKSCCSLSKFVYFAAALALRFALIYIADYVDHNSETFSYTDVDYEVFTDAAKHVAGNGSPYARHTYRYTPLAAYICLVNIWVHPLAGKVVFCLLDILMGLIYWTLVDSQLKSAKQRTCGIFCFVSLWLFNPVTFVMSTRGSNDNIIALLVFVSLFLLLKRQYVLAGFFYGLSVHFKIYPIIYCFVFYFYIDCDRSMIRSGKPLQAITSQYPFFSHNRLVFTIVSASTFIGFTALFYFIYGDEFLQESLLYHLVRKDHRHNNSVYFYLIYQLYDEPSSTLLALLMFIPQWAVVIASGIIFYYDLFFVMTIQTWAFVMFNKVMTAQYYLWYLTLLPIAVINNEFASSKRHYLVVVTVVWAACQFLWLYYAEQFEFHFGDTIACMQYANYVFFVVNLAALCYFIKFQQLQVTPELVSAKTTPTENKKGKSD